MISLQQMQYIIALSEELHFQRASERCFVSQPTLSMQIKKAEDLLGNPIFDRTFNPLSLTVFGNEVVEIIRAILIENDRLKLLKSRYQDNYKEEIKLGVIPTVAAYLIPKMFGHWRTTMGEVKIAIEELTTEVLLDKLVKNEIDIAIFAGPHSSINFKTVPLFVEEILIYCPSYKKKQITINELQQFHPWLLSKGNCLRTQMIQFCQLSDSLREGKWNYQGGNLKLLMEMVDNEGGYTLIPENLPISAKRKKAVIKVKSSFGAPAREIIAVFPSRSMKLKGLNLLALDVQKQFSSEFKQKKLDILGWK